MRQSTKLFNSLHAISWCDIEKNETKQVEYLKKVDYERQDTRVDFGLKCSASVPQFEVHNAWRDTDIMSFSTL